MTQLATHITPAEANEASPMQPQEQDGLRLWMERGHGRTNIAKCMMQAVPGIKIYSSTKTHVPGTETLMFPDPAEGLNVEQLNRTIAAHAIDTVWVQDSAKHDLTGIQADVHAAAPPDIIRLLDNKVRFTEWFEDTDPFKPDMVGVVGADAVRKEYIRRRAEGRNVCIKPAVGVSGQGYWHLAETGSSTFLDTPEKRQIHPEIYLAALAIREAENEPELLAIMDYLPGPEASIDLLCWRGEPLKHAARTKYEGGHRRLEDVESEHPVVDHAYQLAEHMALHGIVNVQYRLDQDQNWKILEINPRPAGGSVISEAAGFGVISDWTRLIAGEMQPHEARQHHGKATVEVARALELVTA